MRRRGFTLTELLIAVVILVVLIVAVAKIFSTVSTVTSIGQANAAFLQSVPAIERQVRGDLARLSDEGFMVIRNVRVRNDVNQAADASAPLLDRTLAPGDWLRCDQILFFSNGIEDTRTFVGSGNLIASGGAAFAPISRVIISHGFEVETPALVDPAGFADSRPMVPWARDIPGQPQLDLVTWPAGANAGRVPGTQRPAAEWLLVRQRVLLADDGGSPLYFNLSPAANAQGQNSTGSIWLAASGGDWAADATDNALRSGRVDIAALSTAQINRRVLFRANGTSRPWFEADGQRAAMRDALYWPRASRTAPSMDRRDQMLVASTLGWGVASMSIDWTYADGVGRMTDSAGNLLLANSGTVTLAGMVVRPGFEQPWFGIADNARNVRPISAGAGAWPTIWGDVYPPIRPNAIELASATLQGYPADRVQVYEAYFGFNRRAPLGNDNVTQDEDGYTPYPTALRFTFTVVDPREDSAVRRQVQFVVDLPGRRDRAHAN
ncbi:MAG TPA: prepilin-type N-terminal cleavage/methylation domain-containing protein [Phycisphaerales bacterium]|nr:prepilin-type N-terminal cleavage/methylation domain-containing protein [Phycisphaerales bacterium]HMP36622.1 prepilin-type N-terminal cleavage/methylation domain-containing protein [Phycisphaerales bacterium]